jgi:hypothetical protein
MRRLFWIQLDEEQIHGETDTRRACAFMQMAFLYDTLSRLTAPFQIV